MRVLVTGGAGFIGSALVRALVASADHDVVTVDKLTYAGNLESLAELGAAPNHRFVHADIVDESAIREVFETFRPDIVYHLAAESHVDRSIDGPREFVTTNVMGTFVMLTEALRHFRTLSGDEQARFRFLHVSTDEVFGSLDEGGFFTEATAYDPSSPYSATKAASDHLARAWHRTFGLPVLITNCSNNYGPYQFPEKLIPHMIVRATAGQTLPVYGTGANVRDWLHVDDHVRALRTVTARGRIGETYLISGRSERQNLEVVQQLCAVLDRERPRMDGSSYTDLITFVRDRPGHDFRYAIDASKLEQELEWTPTVSFETGLEATVRWYLEHEQWWQRILSGAYRAERVGLTEAA
jgi:dTDP-glucose 4,6-dehydratase